MNIDEAIQMLKDEKKRGVRNIVIAHWTAEAFDRQDDAAWAVITDRVMDLDWSMIGDSVLELIADAEQDQDIA